MLGTVLLAEDNVDVRNVMVRILKRFKFEVVECADGPTAVSLFRAEPARFRIVLLDQCMPSGDEGIEAFIEIRKIDPGILGVILSGNGETSVRARCDELGAKPSSVIGKPFNLKDLRARLSELLGETI